jgi:hypothetical protein
MEVRTKENNKRANLGTVYYEYNGVYCAYKDQSVCVWNAQSKLAANKSGHVSKYHGTLIGERI